MLFGTWGNAIVGNNGKGILEIRENIECPVCLETKQGISQPKCDHFVCIDCFKRCYYGEEIEQPPFPYPEIEEEYDDDPDNPKWKTEYPLIGIYNAQSDLLEQEKWDKRENEAYLRSCPMCRK
jgi:hypothetical protein